jgi:hypothetical protein
MKKNPKVLSKYIKKSLWWNSSWGRKENKYLLITSISAQNLEGPQAFVTRVSWGDLCLEVSNLPVSKTWDAIWGRLSQQMDVTWSKWRAYTSTNVSLTHTSHGSYPSLPGGFCFLLFCLLNKTSHPTRLILKFFSVTMSQTRFASGPQTPHMSQLNTPGWDSCLLEPPCDWRGPHSGDIWWWPVWGIFEWWFQQQNKIMPLAGKWIELEIIVLSKISQTQINITRFLSWADPELLSPYFVKCYLTLQGSCGQRAVITRCPNLKLLA